MGRPSVHEEPRSAAGLARHYIRDLVYGANDGVITTFAVVSAVVGGSLSTRAVLVVGIANLFADGLSMGVGNYLSIRSHESALAAESRPEEEAYPARHGLATFGAFVLAGAVPLLPFAGAASATGGFPLSIVLTFLTLFVVGALRSTVTADRWWLAGAEMLGLGVLVALAAYGSGAIVTRLIGDTP